MNRCPVCRRAVNRTFRGNIARHTDTLNIEVCPMSDERYELSESGAAARVWLPTRNGIARDYTRDVSHVRAWRQRQRERVGISA